MSKVPVGAFIATATTPPEQVGPLARQVEDLGFGEVWVAEDCFYYGGFTSAGLALQSTTDITVGLGIISSMTRHPAMAAMEIATLARVHPGRFLAGIGHGVPAWTDQMGLTPRSPLTALNECVTSIRRLLSGETVADEGRQFTFRDVSLAFLPDTEVPLLTGVLGSKSLRLSGRIADGTVLSVLAGTKYIEYALEHIRGGMTEAGRSSHLLPTYALFSANKDSKAARAAVRPLLAFYLEAVGPRNALTGAFGYNDHLAELLSEGGTDRLVREMPEEWIDELAVAGSPDQVGERIEQLLKAGATSVVLSPVNPESAAEELELVAKSVLPALGR
ncbi:LLM class flavin-dependent oxidoreductase [Streptomyces spiralis]